MPTVMPLEALIAPARMARRDLSAAVMEISLPVRATRSLSLVPSAMVTLLSALLTSTENAPSTGALPPWPMTAPASDCAASFPAKSPSKFCVKSASNVTSPTTSTVVPVATFTFASLRLTLTATPAAMELLLFAVEMAAPVPSVLKLPSFFAVRRTSAPSATELILPLSSVVAL